MEGVGTRRLLTLALLFAVSCGGGTTESPAKTAREASNATADVSSDPNANDESEKEAAAPKPALCGDGSCITCGTGICPTGWYCDESAPGGPACGWVPGCEKKKSICNCLGDRFQHKCRCTEDNGGALSPHLKCE